MRTSCSRRLFCCWIYFSNCSKINCSNSN
jgi:hypothetical protein